MCGFRLSSTQAGMVDQRHSGFLPNSGGRRGAHWWLSIIAHGVVTEPLHSTLGGHDPRVDVDAWLT